MAITIIAWPHPSAKTTGMFGQQLRHAGNNFLGMILKT